MTEPSGNPTRLSAIDAARLIRTGAISAAEMTRACLDRIREVDERVRALLTVMDEDALEAAKEMDAAIGAQPDAAARRPLLGVPIVVKDNICTCGVRTTCGSNILRDYAPPYDATVVSRLRKAGAVVIGKSNLDEFAMGSSTENSAFGPSCNPWSLDRVPGGSSGGSAAALAALECPLALGSDTGGSIRQPASLCGVVGLKPTYGRVSRYGLAAYASSLDQIGPMARTVRDAALMLSVIAGRDPADATSADVPTTDYVGACEGSIRGLKIGVPREYFGSGVDPGVAEAVRQAIETLCGMGAVAEECSMPTTDHCLPAYYILAPSEASSNLARYDGVKYGHRTQALSDGWQGMMEATRAEGFGAEVKQRIMIGTYALSAGYYDAYYRTAQQIRTLIRRDFASAFERFDVLITPTSPVTAFRIGERSDDPLAMKLADVCTLPANMAGVPAISSPCGFIDGLPVGMQIMAPPFDEEALLRVAHAYEEATEWHRRIPHL